MGVGVSAELGRAARVTLDKLISWSEHAFRREIFSGTGLYTRIHVQAGALAETRVGFSTGDVRVMARLTLNGKETASCEAAFVWT